ncbi:hypothetical protein LR004_00005, partial [Candidatus Gracilibacteria bacterium]|nr:hypothetical protein [Candidatus Gracilibacteria bacterium]
MLHIIKNYRKLFLGLIISSFVDKQRVNDMNEDNNEFIERSEIKSAWNKGGKELNAEIMKNPVLRKNLNEGKLKVADALNAIGKTINTASQNTKVLKKELNSKRRNSITYRGQTFTRKQLEVSDKQYAKNLLLKMNGATITSTVRQVKGVENTRGRLVELTAEKGGKFTDRDVNMFFGNNPGWEQKNSSLHTKVRNYLAGMGVEMRGNGKKGHESKVVVTNYPKDKFDQSAITIIERKTDAAHWLNKTDINEANYKGGDVLDNKRTATSGKEASSKTNTGNRAYQVESTGVSREVNQAKVNVESAKKVLSSLSTTDLTKMMQNHNKKLISRQLEAKGYDVKGWFLQNSEGVGLNSLVRKYQMLGARANAYSQDELVKIISDFDGDGILDTKTRAVGEAQLRNAIKNTKGGFTNVLKSTGFGGVVDFRRQLNASPYITMTKIQRGVRAYINSGGATVATVVEGRTAKYNRILEGTERKNVMRNAETACYKNLGEIKNAAVRKQVAKDLSVVAVEGAQRVGGNPADFIQHFSRNLNISHQLNSGEFGVTYNGLGNFASGLLPYKYGPLGGRAKITGNPTSIFGPKVSAYPLFVGAGAGINLKGTVGGNVEVGYKNVDKKVANIKVAEARKILGAIVGIPTEAQFKANNFYKNSTNKAGDIAVFRQMKNMQKQR